MLWSNYLFTIGIIYLLFSVCGIIGTLIFITGEIYSNGNLFIKTACIESDISCHGLFKFSSSFPLDTKTHGIIFYYIYLKKISKDDQAKNLASSFSILLIYFCQFYLTLFEKILDFNFDKKRFGKCVVHDFIIKDKNEKFEELRVDNIRINVDNNDQYYKNNLNDSYFNKQTNYKEKDTNKTKDVRISEFSENKQSITRRIILPPINRNNK